MRYINHIFFIGASVMLLSCRSAADKKADWIKEYPEAMGQGIDTIDNLTRLFPKSSEQIKAWTEASMQLARQELDVMLTIPGSERTFNNTVRALDHSQSKMSRFASLAELASMTNPDKEMRDAGHVASTELSQFSVDLYLNPDLYRAFHEYYDHNGKTENLTDEERYYLEESMSDLKRSGLALPPEKLSQVKQLKKDMAQIGNDFSLNIATDMPTIKVGLNDLKGINSDMIASLKKDGVLYVLGVDYPTYFEVMEKCQVAATRRAMYFAFNNRAYPKNDPLLKDLFKKRDEVAKLLGYKNFASLDIDNTMAKTEAQVERFLQNLASIASKKCRKELAVLSAQMPDGAELTKDGLLHAWDYMYVHAAYKQANFDIDESKIAEYFPVQKALDGMFAIYQNFLGLTFKEIKPSWAWHEEVRLIEVYCTETNKFLGHLLLDLYPRDNKYTHACYVPLVPSFKVNGVNTPSVGVVIANFPRPSGDKPALLKHADVETFFHEFGHAMHGVLGRTEMAGMAGTSVKTDYVEMPSQMFEEWMLESEILKKISSHYKTGEPLPDEIIQKKIELKKFDSGFFVVRQCMLAFLSLNLGQADKHALDPAALWRAQFEKYMSGLIRFEPEAHQHAAFGHLAASNYASKYYGYMWSKVFAVDIFAEVKKHGILNKEIGQRVAQGLLGKGGSIDPEILLHTFLGRDPNQEAFLHDLGLQ